MNELKRLAANVHRLTHSFTHSLTHSPTHPPTQPPNHQPTHSLSHSLTRSLARSLIHSLTHLLTHSLTQPIRCKGCCGFSIQPDKTNECCRLPNWQIFTLFQANAFTIWLTGPFDFQSGKFANKSAFIHLQSSFRNPKHSRV